MARKKKPAPPKATLKVTDETTVKLFTEGDLLTVADIDAFLNEVEAQGLGEAVVRVEQTPDRDSYGFVRQASCSLTVHRADVADVEIA